MSRLRSFGKFTVLRTSGEREQRTIYSIDGKSGYFIDKGKKVEIARVDVETWKEEGER